MCDYSLELYRSRPAQVGESYENLSFSKWHRRLYRAGGCLHGRVHGL